MNLKVPSWLLLLLVYFLNPFSETLVEDREISCIYTQLSTDIQQVFKEFCGKNDRASNEQPSKQKAKQAQVTWKTGHEWFLCRMILCSTQNPIPLPGLKLSSPSCWESWQLVRLRWLLFWELSSNEEGHTHPFPRAAYIQWHKARPLPWFDISLKGHFSSNPPYSFYWGLCYDYCSSTSLSAQSCFFYALKDVDSGALLNHLPTGKCPSQRLFPRKRLQLCGDSCAHRNMAIARSVPGRKDNLNSRSSLCGVCVACRECGGVQWLLSKM